MDKSADRALRPAQLETETPDRRARGVRGPLLAHSLDCHLAVAPCVKSQSSTHTPSVFFRVYGNTGKLVIFYSDFLIVILFHSVH